MNFGSYYEPPEPDVLFIKVEGLGEYEFYPREVELLEKSIAQFRVDIDGLSEQEHKLMETMVDLGLFTAGLNPRNGATWQLTENGKKVAMKVHEEYIKFNDALEAEAEAERRMDEYYDYNDDDSYHEWNDDTNIPSREEDEDP